MDPAKLNAMKVPELKSALQERGLSTAGLKAELVERLNAALLAGDGAGGAEAEAAAAAAPPTAETASASDPALDEAPVCAPAGPSSGFPATEAPAVETPAVAAEPAATGGAEAAAPAAAAPTEAGTKRDASEMDSGAQESDQAAKKQAVEGDPNLPHPWQQHISSRTGKPYWYNPDTKETTWICPIPKVAPAAAQSSGGTPAATNAGTGQLPLRPGAVKCKHFLKFGVCKFGESCRYDHPPDEAGKELDTQQPAPRTGAAMLPNGVAQTGGLPVRPNEKECSYFMKTGMCKYGETCRWHHPPEKQTKDVKFVKPNDAGMGAAPAGMGMNGMGMNGMGMMGNSGMGMMGMGMPGMLGMAANMAAKEWEMHMSDEGRPYYFNSRTQESTWEAPPAMMMGMMSGMMGMGGMVGGMGTYDNVRMLLCERVCQRACGCMRPSTLCQHSRRLALRFVSLRLHVCRHAGGMGSMGAMGGMGASPGKRALASGFSGGQHPIRPGEPDCSFYVKTGSCKFGETCKFNHPPEMLGVGGDGKAGAISGSGGFKNSQPAQVTAEGYPVRPGQPDCSFYMKTGQCKFSSTCKYNHPHKGLSGLPDATGMSKF